MGWRRTLEVRRVQGRRGPVVTAIELRQRKAYISNVRAQIDGLSAGWRDPGLPTSEVGTLRGVVAAKDGKPQELQEELREARAERRSYNVLTNHLLQAQRAGFNTPEGRQRVKDAHAEALDPTPNKEWDW